MPPLPADFIHARACKLKCEKILTRPLSGVLTSDRLGSKSDNEKSCYTDATITDTRRFCI